MVAPTGGPWASISAGSDRPEKVPDRGQPGAPCVRQGWRRGRSAGRFDGYGDERGFGEAELPGSVGVLELGTPGVYLRRGQFHPSLRGVGRSDAVVDGPEGFLDVLRLLAGGG